MKTAVVLFNLGGPQQESDIRPFLFNFFMDKNIIGAPQPLRWLIAKYIAATRSRGAAHDAYAKLNFKSPLLDNSRAQAAALEAVLRQRGMEARCFVSMRYWHPMAPETARLLKAYAPEQLVLLPLYPQYSTTTTGSSFEDFRATAPQDSAMAKSVCCYPVMEGFIKASAELIRAEFAKAPANTRLLLSAHGLPEKVIEAGDPYQKQCEETAAAIVKELNLPGLDWQVCYQSRVGPQKWIGPSIDEALQKAAKDGKGVVVYPHAFVSEHVETLVELDMEYRHRAQELKIPYYARVSTVGTHPAFVAGLAQLVQDSLAGARDNCAATCCGRAGN